MTPSPRPGWMLDEVGSAGRENLDAAHVARYDEKEDAAAAAEVALLVQLGLGADSTVVEFGPGTGQFTVAVAPRCGRVVAVDVSAPMIERLRALLAPGGVLRLWDVVFDFEPAAAEARIEAWCASGGETVEGEWSRAELEEHVRDEHSTFTWLLEPIFERCGFAIEAAAHSEDGIFAEYVLRAR